MKQNLVSFLPRTQYIVNSLFRRSDKRYSFHCFRPEDGSITGCRDVEKSSLVCAVYARKPILCNDVEIG